MKRTLVYFFVAASLNFCYSLMALSQSAVVTEIRKIDFIYNDQKNISFPQWSFDNEYLSFEVKDENSTNIFIYKLKDRSSNKISAVEITPRSRRRITVVEKNVSWNKHVKDELYFLSSVSGNIPQLILRNISKETTTDFLAEIQRKTHQEQITDFEISPMNNNIIILVMGGEKKMDLYNYIRLFTDKIIFNKVTELSNMTIVYPNFSPDAGGIVFTGDIDGDTNIYAINNFSPGVKNLDLNSLLKLTNTKETEICPSYSPDGSKIAFISTRQVEGFPRRRLYIMDKDGGNIRLLNDNISFNEPFGYVWHPQGTYIFFIKFDSINRTPICCVNYETGETNILKTETENNKTIAVSNDGRYIAFSAGGQKNDKNLTWSSIYYGNLKIK